MNEIDYSKWYGSKFCPVCVKKLEDDDLGTREVEVRGRYGTNKVESSVCKECGSHALVFQSPARFVLISFIISIMMSGLFFFLKLGAENISTMDIYVVTGVFVLATCAIIAILIHDRNKSKDVIKKLESTN
jgi:hypothetical protein